MRSTFGHLLCTLDSELSHSLGSQLCTLALCSHRALCFLLSTLCPCTLCTFDSVLSPLCSRTVLTLSAFTISALSTLDSRNLCTLVFVLSDCTLDSAFWHSLYPRLCTLVFCILTHSSFSHSRYSRVCTLPLHSQTVLSSCTVLPLDSVPLHSLHSQLCTLDSALSTLYSQLSALSTIYSRVCTLTLYLALCSHRALCSLWFCFVL